VSDEVPAPPPPPIDYLPRRNHARRHETEDDKPTLAYGETLVDELNGTEFQVYELIGRGGMGEVYRAKRLPDGARCAVKCVRRDLVQNATILLRTRFEAKAFRQDKPSQRGAGPRHRGPLDNVPWMAMEWLDGFTLAEIIERKGRSGALGVQIVRDLCLGLQGIHPYAIHRDIKPSNAHLGFDAVTRALDLGRGEVQGDQRPPHQHRVPGRDAAVHGPGAARQHHAHRPPGRSVGRTVLLYLLMTGSTRSRSTARCPGTRQARLEAS